ncbi:unnamed protein product [Rhizopus stolonifer]
MSHTDIKQIPSIVNEVKAAFRSGITKDLAFRKNQLKKLQLFIEENKDSLAEAIHKDLRRPKMEFILGEIVPTLGEIDFMLKNMDVLSQPVFVKSQYKLNSLDKLMIRKQPRGVLLIMGAWNFPVVLLLQPVIGAIAAGNCIVMKPSEQSGHTAQFFADVLPKYLDPRAYIVVTGAVKETQELLSQQFDQILYTGGGNVGKIIMEAASKTLTPVILELGGKCPVFVAPDANLHMTAKRVLWGKFCGAGQMCVSPDHVFIPKSNMDEFVDICRKLIYERYGSDPQKSDSYSRIVNEKRFDVLQHSLNSLDPQKILVGGKMDREDLYIAPTIVGPLEHNNPSLMQEEIFGPILPIIPVEDMDEAIKIADQKPTPLALYIFSDDTSIQEKIMSNTNSGGILVNDVIMHVLDSALPFGGVGPSGVGAYHGAKSFEAFSHERSTMIKSSGLESLMEARYPPYTDDKLNINKLLLIGLPEAFTAKIGTIYQAIGSAYRTFFSK